MSLNFEELYALSQKIKAEEKIKNKPKNDKEETEFLKIAEDISQGRTPYDIVRTDNNGNKKTYSYSGDIWYSEISQWTKHFTTYEKRSRAYDYVYNYLKEHKFNVHS